jgi:uncharacterized OB-fold protein
MSRALDWTAGADAILVHRCAACGHAFYFARDFCPSCGAAAVAAEPVSGRGTVYAATLVARAPSPELRALAPYTILLVDLDEGVRMMAHGESGLAIGDRVEAGFVTFAGRRLPRFRRATSG